MEAQGSAARKKKMLRAKAAKGAKPADFTATDEYGLAKINFSACRSKRTFTGDYMSKRIIICSDGTWNTPDQKDEGVISPTNVAKLAMCVAPFAGDGRRQLLYYDSGVGTNWYDRIRGGVSGVGISRNILQAYRFLMKQYEDGDDIFLFGFSRGAYTVRSLGGLLRNSGLLHTDNLHKLDDAYRLYRRRDKESHPRAIESELFRRTYSREVRVHCIGVWDTVGALGIPSRNFDIVNKLLNVEFHDVDLSSRIDNAFQALAIDERRSAFEPCVWRKQDSASSQRLEQVWFSGVHSNIGGGYRDTGLSDIALSWMMERAEECGLEFDPAPLERLEIAFHPAWNGKLVNSKKGIYRLFPDYVRPIEIAPEAGTTVAPQAWQRFNTDPAYRESCANLARISHDRQA